MQSKGLGIQKKKKDGSDESLYSDLLANLARPKQRQQDLSDGKSSPKRRQLACKERGLTIQSDRCALAVLAVQSSPFLSLFNKCTAKSRTGEKNDEPVIRGTNIPMSRVINNHRDLPEAMKQRMHLTEETDSWSLAEMQWILDLHAFAQKAFSMTLAF
ncbi:hypothetical protein V8E54_004610 [Elaphomyces granulatus]